MSIALNEVTSDQGICCFCKFIDKQKNLVAAGTLYVTKTKTQIDHVKNMTANWIEMAKSSSRWKFIDSNFSWGCCFRRDVLL